MVDLSMVAIRLRSMKQQLQPYVDAVSWGASKELLELNLRLAQPEQMVEELGWIIREIQSDQNQRDLGSLLRGSERQKNLQNAKKQATDLAKTVLDLMEKHGFLSSIKASMPLPELVEMLQSAPEEGAAIRQLSSELGVPSIAQPQDPLVPVLMFIIYGLGRIAEKNRRLSRAAGD